MRRPVFLRIFRQLELVGVKQFTGEQIVIGRETSVDLQLDDESVSPIHSMIELREDAYFVCDLGSDTGTNRNGRPALDEKIESGDRLEIGIFSIEFYIGVPKPKSKPDSVPEKIVPVVVNPPPIRAKSTQVSSSAGGMEIESPVPPRIPMDIPVSHHPQEAKKSRGAETLRETMKPGKGSLLEVVVGWRDRVLNTYTFEKKQIITLGTHPKNDIVLPSLRGTRQSFPLIKWDTLPQILIANDMMGEVTRDRETTSFEKLLQDRKTSGAGGGLSRIDLNQEELVRIDFSDGVSIFIRFVSSVPKPLAAPLLSLATSEITVLVGSAIFMCMVGLYMAVYTPELPEEKPPEVAELMRKAIFVYKKQGPDMPKTQAETTEQESKAISQPGGNPIKTSETKPAEAKPNNSNSTKKVLTATNVGSGNGSPQNQKKTGAMSSAGAPAPRPDVKKSGLLGVFGRSGTQSDLEKAFRGASEAGTLGSSASGKAGLGVGENPNAKGPGLREVGQGGTGVATVGIAGVGTKGRGGGNVGYGEGSLGGKKGVRIIPGGSEENFSGTIDREAIRRVIQDNLRQIKACYERGLVRDGTLGGKIVLRWTIGPQGVVTNAEVNSTTMNNSEVEQCAISRLKQWRFPEPPVGKEAEVIYPFVFTAQQ